MLRRRNYVKEGSNMTRRCGAENKPSTYNGIVLGSVSLIQTPILSYYHDLGSPRRDLARGSESNGACQVSKIWSLHERYQRKAVGRRCGHSTRAAVPSSNLPITRNYSRLATRDTRAIVVLFSMWNSWDNIGRTWKTVGGTGNIHLNKPAALA